jgi:hypothetical protein
MRPDERLWGFFLGALSSLIPVLLTDVERGAAGVLIEVMLLFCGSVFLARRTGRPLRAGVWMMAGLVVAETVALVAHLGLAVFAGTWAPAYSLLLAAVPALLAGAAAGDCLARPDAGKVLPVLAWLAGAACALLLGWSFVAAGLAILAGACALVVLRPSQALLLGCLLAGSAGLVAVVVFFSRPGGPGNMWPVVLPLEALVLVPMAAAGCGAGLLIARAVHRTA